MTRRLVNSLAKNYLIPYNLNKILADFNLFVKGKEILFSGLYRLGECFRKDYFGNLYKPKTGMTNYIIVSYLKIGIKLRVKSVIILTLPLLEEVSYKHTNNSLSNTGGWYKC